jgi:hypothetical protein
MAVSLGPSGLVLDNISIPNDTSNTLLQAKTAGYSSALGTQAVSVSAGAYADLMSITMTVQANSRVMMWFDSHQTEESGTTTNPVVEFHIDGTAVSTNSNHYFYGLDGRIVISKIFMSDALSAGSHVFKAVGGSYSGATTYNFQNSNGGVFMIQEIAE